MLTGGAMSSWSAGEGADLLAEVGIGLHQGLDVPMLDVGRFHPRPLRAREQGVVGSRCQARGVEGPARYEQLRALARPEVGPHGN